MSDGGVGAEGFVESCKYFLRVSGINKSSGVFFINVIFLFLRYRLIDGTKVINELRMDDVRGSNPGSSAGSGGGASRLTGGTSSSQEDSPRCGPEPPPAGHIDGITDVVLCKNQRQMFIASSSRDGVIKLWK